jgi:radical SAM protein with 4Fe4S-binding SPASM domain
MTNGVLVSDDIINFLKDNYCSIQVSIDGLTEEQHDEIRGKGNFKRTLSTVKRLSEAGINTSVHFVVHKLNYPDNIDQLGSFFNLLQELGVKGVTFSLLVPIGRGRSMKELLLTPNEVKVLFQWLIKVSKSYPTVHLDNSRPLWVGIEDCAGGVCPVGYRLCAILPNGDVLPCRRLPIILGNLRKQSFFEIWYSSETLWQLRERKKIAYCGECKFLESCAGCRGMAYAVYGDFMARDPLCFVCNSGQNAVSKKLG